MALVCYQPFWGLFGRLYLPYEGDLTWYGWLEPYPPLRVAWGAVLLVLFAVYVLSTVSFGLRFSNLTHRGILTDGPYRLVRHPAYWSKCVTYWLAAVPFVPAAASRDALRRSSGSG